MMLHTGLGIGEHPILAGLCVELLESKILLEEQFQDIFKFCAFGHQFFKDLTTEMVGVWQLKEYAILGDNAVA